MYVNFAHAQKLKLESKIEGEQPHEEIPPSITLQPGKEFHLTISAEENCFDIFITREEEYSRSKTKKMKEKYYSYAYRSDVTNIKRIVFDGGECEASLSIGRVRESEYTCILMSTQIQSP